MDWKPSLSVGSVIKFALMYAAVRFVLGALVNFGGSTGSTIATFIENPFQALKGATGN
jgi:hypothetical protein